MIQAVVGMTRDGVRILRRSICCCLFSATATPPEIKTLHCHTKTTYVLLRNGAITLILKCIHLHYTFWNPKVTYGCNCQDTACKLTAFPLRLCNAEKSLIKVAHEQHAMISCARSVSHLAECCLTSKPKAYAGVESPCCEQHNFAQVICKIHQTYLRVLAHFRTHSVCRHTEWRYSQHDDDHCS